MQRIKKKTKKNQGITYGSNRIPSAIGKKKRGRGRPKKSEQKRNHKARKLMEEAKVDPKNSHPT
ncbi:unnamed protein product [Cyberlindnera jadinii]|uniref:Uncharacterized protein n=1 Tax=Cyberlindnera jadinii (strain ATCC 18201 / CBS 1600 / BCRC 20928 / JCM 3617 / NBRC 0987 / NRRL Y-1542) TaxID=983966 RepID=A0A0H5C3A1_CYBJN|nr:unnamed protein product [Cyberlindnera jadinii]